MTIETLEIHARFPLGHIVATRGAMEVLGGADGDPRLAMMLLARHAAGDCGDMDDEDKETNEEAIRFGNRVMSVYRLIGGATVWVMTEADRSLTTFLLPDEY